MIVKNITNYLEKNDLKVTDFAKRCRLRPTTVYSILSKQTKNPTLDILTKISNEMGVTIDELAKNDKKETDDIKKIYDSMKMLDDREKAKIYAMMRGAIHAVKEFERKS